MRPAALVALVLAAAPAVPQDAPGHDPWVLRVLDVRDLVAVRRDFPPPRLGIVSAGSATSAQAGDASVPAAHEQLDALVAELRALPGVAWDGAASVESRDGSLVVRQRATAMQAVEAALVAHREAAQRMVSIEARVLALDHESARALPRGLHVIDVTQAERLLERCRTSTHARLLQAPRLTAFDGQLANVMVANELAYVAGLDLEAAPGTLVADPVIGTLREGMSLGVRARRADDGWLHLHLDLQLATLLRPLPELATRFGVIQVPQIVSQAQVGQVRVPDGGWVLVAGLADVKPDGSTPGTLLVLVRATNVRLDDAPAGRGR